MKTYLHGSMDYAKTLKLRFRVEDLDLPEKRKRYASSREEEQITQMYSCGKAVESRTHLVGECEIYNKERDLLEMRKIDECDMEKFGTLNNREKTIAILGDRLWSQTAKRKGHKLNQEFLPCLLYTSPSPRDRTRSRMPSSA